MANSIDAPTFPDAAREVAVGRSAAGPSFCVREIQYAAGYRQGKHAHERASVTLLLRGALRETAAGREENATVLSVVVKPAGVVHADEVGPAGARTLQVVLEDEAAFLGDPARELGAWRWIHAGAGVRPLLGLQRALWDAAADLEDPVLEALGEVVAEPGPASDDPPGWLARAREALDDDDPTASRVRDLAAAFDVHPVSLTRAFRRAYGVPVSVYRRRLRLRRAAAQISGTDRPLTRIAHAAGYADHAHLCREVRGATGLTPSALRDAARRG